MCWDHIVIHCCCDGPGCFDCIGCVSGYGNVSGSDFGCYYGSEDGVTEMMVIWQRGENA